MDEPFLTLNPDVVDQLLKKLKAETEKKLPGAFREPHRFPPSKEHLEQLLRVAYWAGYERNEGRTLTFSLVLVPPPRIPDDVIVFEKPVPLEAQNLVGLAPVAERCFGLGVVDEGDGWQLWGVVLRPIASLTLKAVEPGLLLLRLEYDNVAVIDGSECVISGLGPPQAVSLLAEGFSATLAEPQRTVVAALLLQIADSIRRHGNGGTVLVVPSGTDGWLRHVKIRRPLVAFTSLAKKCQRYVEKVDSIVRAAPGYIPPGTMRPSWYALVEVGDIHNYLKGDYAAVSPELQRAVLGVGGLTAVDGAVVLNDRLEVIGFGALLEAGPSREDVGLWTLPSIIARREPDLVSPDDPRLGGTRHRSAVLFVAAHQDSVALVVSHDGPVSVVAWDTSRKKVVVFRRVELMLDSLH